MTATIKDIMKFGFDIHGVLNKQPAFFSTLTQELVSTGNEVHIITGSMITESIKNELTNYGLKWTHLFSITDHHLQLGNKVEFDDKGGPWIEETLWNKTKAIYCGKNQINFHMDDSLNYGQYFTTPYCLYNYNRKRCEWYYLDEAAGEFLFCDDEMTKNIIINLAKSFSSQVSSKYDSNFFDYSKI